MRAAALLAALVAVPAAADGTRLKLATELVFEARYFMHDPAFAGQRGSGVAVALKPELHFEWSGGASSFTLTPFARWDQRDDERTHADLRELVLRHRAGPVEVHAGVRTVFWGATESVHLVDVLNQTDAVENPDGEDKLGQPMLDAVWNAPFGDVEVFVLPYFRERRLPGAAGRLRGPLPFAPEPVYESGAEERHVDGALRWSIHPGDLDLSLSAFKGTGRAPRFALDPFAPGGPVLVPVYDQIEQLGLEATYVVDAWLLKLEAIDQDSRAGHFRATAGGFEYTLGGALGTAADVGLLAEYLWDSRGERAATPFQRDLFLGTRVALNDEAGTELLAGGVIDLQQDGVFGNLEASRRLGDDGKIVLEVRLFERAAPSEPLYNFRRDDYVQLEYVRYF